MNLAKQIRSGLNTIFCRGQRYPSHKSVGYILIASICLTDLAWSQEQPASASASAPIQVIHRAPAAREIPALGSLMKVSLELTNTYDIDTKVRLVGAKDGRFIDISFPQGSLNNEDRPTFSVDLPSPIAAMSYQFIIHQKDGKLTSSPKYLMKRDCLQTFAVDVPDGDSSATYKREVGTLVAKAKSLERDTASLEASLKLLEEMKTSLSK